MNVDSDKPKYLECLYDTPITFDLEELGIDWDEVEDWDLLRADLHITFKDGTEKTYENWQDLDIDYKHNFEEVLILDEDWEKVEGLN